MVCLLGFALGALPPVPVFSPLPSTPPASFQQQSAPDLPNPFVVMKDRVEAGDPLAQYVELLRLEPQYLKGVGLLEAHNGKPLSAAMASTYAQARATVEGNLGAIARSLRTQTLGWYYAVPKRAVTESPLDAMKRVDAVEYLVRQADTHPWIMVGEEHMKPQTRTLLLPLLRALRKRGFSYFAAEAFAPDVNSTLSHGSPTWKSGFYTKDPVFAEAIREAIRLGYKLVEYEAEEHPDEVPPDDPWFAQNFREHLQAQNLKTRIFDKDPSARVLVWAGRSHVVKVASKQPDGEFRPMGYEFKSMTGVDPLSVYLPTDVEGGAPNYETAEYQYATAKNWIPRPTIFIGEDGSAFGLGDGEIRVFFPRTTYVRGRPDWLARDLGRVARAIPPAMIAADGYLLAQVWLEGEPVEVVPVDQILIAPGEPVPVLMVPKGKRLWMRVIDASGKVLGRAELKG